MTPSKSVKPYTPHPTPYPHEKLFQQTLIKGESMERGSYTTI
ncbi:MAG: hypothetical protein PX637_22670 [Microcystis sp. M53601_WE4]|nr:hypothetical protein [Microcystis sp. M53601_WE4]